MEIYSTAPAKERATEPLRLCKQAMIASVIFLSGARIAYASHVPYASWSSITTWNTATRRFERMVSAHRAAIMAMAALPGGKQFVSCSDNIILWDGDTGDKVREFNGHEKPVNDVAPSPDGKYLVSASRDLTARVWDVETGACLRVLEGHDNTVLVARFLGDGETVVTTSAVDRFERKGKNSIRLWDWRAGEWLHRVTWEHESDADETFVFSLALSPLGDVIAASNADGVALWTTKLAQKSTRVTRANERWVAFAPDGSHFATVSQTLRLWDLECNLIAECDVYDDPLYCVAFSPDGATIVVAGIRGLAFFDAATLERWTTDTPHLYE